MEESILESLAKWLLEYVGMAKVRSLIPAQHPAKMWWKSHPDCTNDELEILVKLLANGGHLPLLASILLLTRSEAIKQPPRDVDFALGKALQQMDVDILSKTTPVSDQDPIDVFVCYAHEDTPRVNLICRVLKEAGLSVFRDTDSIRPGASIAAMISIAVQTTRSSVIIVSKASNVSKWVNRETKQLINNKTTRSIPIYTLVIDDVDIPELIRDIFAIDLRDLQLNTEMSWLTKELQPLIVELQKEG